MRDLKIISQFSFLIFGKFYKQRGEFLSPLPVGYRLFVFSNIFEADRNERDDRQFVNIFAVQDADRDTHGAFTLALAILLHGAVKAAFFDRDGSVIDEVNTGDNNFVLHAGSFEGFNSTQRHFVVVGHDSADLIAIGGDPVFDLREALVTLPVGGFFSEGLVAGEFIEDLVVAFGAQRGSGVGEFAKEDDITAFGIGADLVNNILSLVHTGIDFVGTDIVNAIRDIGTVISGERVAVDENERDTGFGSHIDDRVNAHRVHSDNNQSIHAIFDHGFDLVLLLQFIFVTISIDIFNAIRFGIFAGILFNDSLESIIEVIARRTTTNTTLFFIFFSLRITDFRKRLRIMTFKILPVIAQIAFHYSSYLFALHLSLLLMTIFQDDCHLF